MWFAMTLPVSTLLDASPYRQLRAPERAFVDAYVKEVEREAIQRQERITFALHRSFTPEQVASSRGFLERPLVLAAIGERINQIARDTELSVERVLKVISNIAFSNIENYFDIGEDGQPYLNLSKATPDQMEAVQSITIEEQTSRSGMKRTIKFAMHDKLGAARDLMKYTGAFADDNAHWRQTSAPPITHIPADASNDAAAELYASQIDR